MPDLPKIEDVAVDQVYAKICVACHGEKAEGKLELNSPALAGMPSWYTLEQIRKFRNGSRGMNPLDIPGTQMKIIAMGLSEDQLIAAAKEIEKMPSKPTRIIEEGEVENGRNIFAQICMNCHRYNGQGEAGLS